MLLIDGLSAPPPQSLSPRLRRFAIGASPFGVASTLRRHIISGFQPDGWCGVIFAGHRPALLIIGLSALPPPNRYRFIGGYSCSTFQVGFFALSCGSQIPLLWRSLSRVEVRGQGWSFFPKALPLGWNKIALTGRYGIFFIFLSLLRHFYLFIGASGTPYNYRFFVLLTVVPLQREISIKN